MKNAVDAVELYLTNATQDPQEPKWAKDSDIAGMQKTDDPNDEWQERAAIRNSAGAIEFLHDLVDEVTDFLTTDNPIPAKVRELAPMRTKEYGSERWRGGSRLVNAAPVKILEESHNRRKVTIYNGGANPVYLSNLSPLPGAPNGFLLPPSTATLWAPLTLTTRDDVWAVCGAGLTTTLYVAEEFDL